MVGRHKRLRIFSRVLSKRHSKWYAALEQSGISASNFFISLMVLNFAGLATLGEYGFWFALSEFSTLFLAGYAINNMVLYAGHSTIERQRKAFVITLGVVAVLQIIPGVILWSIVVIRNESSSPLLLALPIVLYVALYNFSELTRQFLYMRGRQRLSVIYAAFSVVLSVLVFCFVLFVVKTDSILALAFWCLVWIQFGYIVFATIYSRAWRLVTGLTRKEISDCLAFYWQHGRLASAGMLVAWAQNKSINPVLVLTLDSIAAGYYQVAKMIFMPISMITVGFARSAMKQVRSAWGDGNEKLLRQSIMGHLRSSLLVVIIYLALAAIGMYLSAILDWRQIPRELMVIFIATAVVVVLSNYRYWLSLYFAVQLQFGFLLYMGCIAAILAMLWMLTAGLLFEVAFLVVIGSGIGECFLIAILHRRIKTKELEGGKKVAP